MVAWCKQSWADNKAQSHHIHIPGSEKEKEEMKTHSDASSEHNQEMKS